MAESGETKRNETPPPFKPITGEGFPDGLMMAIAPHTRASERTILREVVDDFVEKCRIGRRQYGSLKKDGVPERKSGHMPCSDR
jgi:hypothetical protein